MWTAGPRPQQRPQPSPERSEFNAHSDRSKSSEPSASAASRVRAQRAECERMQRPSPGSGLRCGRGCVCRHGVVAGRPSRSSDLCERQCHGQWGRMHATPRCTSPRAAVRTLRARHPSSTSAHAATAAKSRAQRAQQHTATAAEARARQTRRRQRPCPERSELDTHSDRNQVQSAASSTHTVTAAKPASRVRAHAATKTRLWTPLRSRLRVPARVCCGSTVALQRPLRTTVPWPMG